MASLGHDSAYVVDPNRTNKRFDVWLFVSAVILLGFGLLSLYSQGYKNRDTQFPKQLFNAVVGLGPFFLMFAVKPRVWMRLARPLYVFNVLLLAAVLLVGSSKFGAQRWIQLGPIQLQPSEIAKLLTVLTLASFFASRQDQIDRWQTFALSALHIAVPAFLIFKQPHLGGAAVIVVIWLAIATIAQVPAKFLLTAIGVLLLGATLILSVPALRSKFLHGYQNDRIGAMTKMDRQAADYQTWRAEIAFGVGGLSGSGFLKGEQKASNVIPFQYNDFVITVLGEEGGLIGCLIVLGCFAFFFYRLWLAMWGSSEPFHRMIAAGVLALLAFHTLVNLAMVTGLIPVVGLWLPFFSAGGTALWLCMACVGLVLSARRQERPVLFS